MATAFDMLRSDRRPYTFVRGEELNDEPGTGNVHAGLAGHMPSIWLTRDDFGLFCVQATEPGFFDGEEPTI